ncbi:bifunctional proline dehydrogenase/L-glutamate gamma-semialdehyde dehydrogenase PutA [Chitinilyticum litopenaei]|uniref:bifunctional proline dehydrogenase/L-glutamate gamma-semialdehyde dehydrogenase PutA n=1 Tax=Chitinilyticum litopenaei TaxID=1121276 RepID=UPI000425B920|nr:bifunctional proline dehydrogenase/L-glutamate gamma-semialdehyde dehydrogenase PutA [Chitinilyticum litopenaei]
MPSHPSLASLEGLLDLSDDVLLAELDRHSGAALDGALHKSAALAVGLAGELAQARQRQGGVDTLLAEFPIQEPSGRALLELSEAMLRIPDQATVDALIREKLQQAHWHGQSGAQAPWLVRLAGWALQHASSWSMSGVGEQIVRPALKLAIEQLGRQFVIARDIETALARRQEAFLYSFDMLGEAALGHDDAERYFAAYLHAIRAVGHAADGMGPRLGPGVSIKLSALHPRFQPLQRETLFAELLPRLATLAQAAREADIGLTIDAEESERLIITLELFERLALSPALAGWDGLGLAVQAYQKRAAGVIDWLAHLAHRRGSSLMVRLVKGAYWDTEIKRAQQLALPAYPVFTRKQFTDRAYLHCAARLFEAGNWLYPQFATHNPHTLAAVLQLADPEAEYEFQCLYGMGESLYRLLPRHGISASCRVYAPVGEQTTLLPYLVRRLLENGANTSFLHRLHLAEAAEDSSQALPAPDAIHAPRTSQPGLDLNRPLALAALLDASLTAAGHHASAAPILANGIPEGDRLLTAVNPALPSDTLGSITPASLRDIEQALAAASQPATPPCSEQTAAWLEACAEQLAQAQAELVQLLLREAGKALPNALSEVREACDFCRYYASEARRNWPEGPLAPLGVLVVISPWNFPLAILTGQIAAALATGNRVLAKPAPQTGLIATRLVHLLHQAGVPRTHLQLLPGDGDTGTRLCADARIAGVLFTGSLPTAQAIRRSLAARDEPRVLIAETGGVNALIVDSSAQLDQVVQQAIESAFDSAGQRCSALRVLLVQSDIAEALWQKLACAMQTLRLGDPCDPATDIGPVIDEAARQRLRDACTTLLARSLRHVQLPLPELCLAGHFVAPALIELPPEQLPREEIFGPLLCFAAYPRERLPDILAQLEQAGYGLTLGIASRLGGQIDAIIARSRIGNYYVNRNQIGALVDEQPFGGCGKSGTGPKAGGPWLLWRLVQDGCPPAGVASKPLPVNLQSLIDSELPPADALRLTLLLDSYPALDRDEALADRPGSTGERNRYGHRALGVLLCTAGDSREALHQVGVALLSGNLPQLSDTEEHRRWQLALPLLQIADTPGAGVPAGVLATPADRPALERQYAATSDALLPVISSDGTGLYPWYRLRYEYCISINTAALGGNAELLAQAPL